MAMVEVDAAPTNRALIDIVIWSWFGFIGALSFYLASLPQQSVLNALSLLVGWAFGLFGLLILLDSRDISGRVGYYSVVSSRRSDDAVDLVVAGGDLFYNEVVLTRDGANGPGCVHLDARWQLCSQASAAD